MTMFLLLAFVANAVAFVTLVPQYVNKPPLSPMDPKGELITQKFRIGPFGPIEGNGQYEGRNVILTRPEPTKLIEIAHFGDFGLEYEDGTTVPRDTLYLHHILAYDQSNGKFVCGCSNERSNWGPQTLPYPYRLLLAPNAVVKAQGFHMNNLKSKPITYYVTYTVKYKVHVPTDPPIRVVESFYWMDNYNVPGGDKRNSTHVRSRTNTITKDMVIVSMNGHLHQGGKRLIVEFDNAPGGQSKELCTTYNLYHDSYPCFWDCDQVCPYKNDWTSQWEMTTCYMEKPVRRGDRIKSIAEYDNSCSWRGVMAWWFNYGWDGTTKGGSSAISSK